MNIQYHERSNNLTTTNVLFLSLNGESSSVIKEEIRRAGVSVTDVNSIEEAQRELLTRNYRVCIARSGSIDDSVYQIAQLLSKHKLPVDLIVSVRQGFVEDAVRVIKAGAVDFIVGESSDARLIESILKTTTNYNATRPRQEPDPRNKPNETEFILVGQSPAMCEIRSAITLVAKSQTTVLVTGESGTGKEIVARLIHLQSNRADNQYVALNCATLPKDVIENELFGHEKGAFTGALQKKEGCFEIADGGTLLFDEIAEMSLETQAKLLRAIETQKFRRLGGKDEINVDVRMIAATNKNIAEALKSKELREDLYYRLSVIEIYIPPLRERKEDISLLIDYFLSIFSKKYEKPVQRFSDEAIELMNAYDWPGNIRELRNIVERALVLSPDDMIGAHYLPQRIQKQVIAQHHINIPVGCSAQEAERMLIVQTLVSTGNNKVKAAKILGVSRKTLHNKLVSFQQ